MYVKDGVLEKIEGDPENPYNQGRLCPRCLAFKEMLYHEDRLKYPMKRAKEDRGKNAFDTHHVGRGLRHHRAGDEGRHRTVRQRGNLGHARARAATSTATGRSWPSTWARRTTAPGFLSGQACYAPRIFSTALKAGGLFVCDYAQFFPDRYDDPRWEAPEYVLVWGNNPGGGQLRRHARPLDRGEHEARQQAHGHGPEAHLGGRQGRRVVAGAARHRRGAGARALQRQIIEEGLEDQGVRRAAGATASTSSPST